MAKINQIIKKITKIIVPRHSAPFYLIFISFLIVVFWGDSNYIKKIQRLTEKEDGFNIMTQLFIPGFSGIAGGYSTVVIASFKNKYIQHNNVFSKFMAIGFIAGVVAVNLLNPSGTVSQVMVLGLLAGLSGFSYLERNALVQTDTEKKALVDDEIKEQAYEDFKKYKRMESTNFDDISERIKVTQDSLRDELNSLRTQKEGDKDE